MTTIQGDGFTVNIIKSKRRKTMALKVDDKGVSAHIPYSLPLATVESFIHKKTAWIQKKLVTQSKYAAPEKQFINGENFLLLGESITLKLIEAEKSPAVIKSGSELLVYGRLKRLSKPAIRAAIIKWYKKQAEGYLTARTHWLSDVTNLHPTTITVKSYKARWGSCSIKGDVNYNWHLIQAPPVVIDYVIIHELCHLSHHNHSSAFWELVAQFSPEYKARRQWLKTHGYELVL